MKVLPFGAISSPSCAKFALKRTANDNEEAYGKEVINTIRHNFYVNDCLKSVATEKQACELAKDLKEVCTKGGLMVTKWVSKSKTVLSSLSEAEKGNPVPELDLDSKRLSAERALGVEWDTEEDRFTFNLNVKQKTPTRKDILSVVNSLYHPLGFLTSFTLKAKQILQELCKSGCSWDETIPETQLCLWEKWLVGWKQLSNFLIPRCMKSTIFGEVNFISLTQVSMAMEL